jgi:hypothetical protein
MLAGVKTRENDHARQTPLPKMNAQDSRLATVAFYNDYKMHGILRMLKQPSISSK